MTTKVPAQLSGSPSGSQESQQDQRSGESSQSSAAGHAEQTDRSSQQQQQQQQPLKQAPGTARRIQKLDQTVVNRIAAGEVIQRPANALKELMENSLDAGSTSIAVVVRDGGLKLLQITDNGHGISREDLPLACERFATSKIRDYSDLDSINSYGFRGEALASISHVAHVSITSRTKDTDCAYKAHYSDGKLVPARPGLTNSDPRPCAGNVGTIVTAEDMFYNVPFRRRAMKSANEEYSRIIDVIGKYAIHSKGVSFVGRKQGGAGGGSGGGGGGHADVQVPTSASTLERIGLIYGSALSSTLVEIQSKEFASLGCTVSGYMTSAATRKGAFILFINHRLVTCTSLKKAIDDVYATYVPKGGSTAFIYLDIQINPNRVDVNVHPTKNEVHFLDQDTTCDSIAQMMQEILAEQTASRTLITQQLSMNSSSQPNSLKQSTLSMSSTANSMRKPNHNDGTRQVRQKMSKAGSTEHEVVFPSTPDSSQPTASSAIEVASVAISESSAVKARMMVRLSSIIELREELIRNEHSGLSQVLREHVFVGIVSDTLALIQHDTRLYLIDYCRLSESIMYQQVLYQFHNFGKLAITPPINISKAIEAAINQRVSSGDVQLAHLVRSSSSSPSAQIAQSITSHLVNRAPMLADYFSIGLTDEGMLTCLPMILVDYVPNMDNLPTFLLRLGTEVDWSAEKSCFRTLAQEIAAFYAVESTDDVRKELNSDFNSGVIPSASQDASVAQVTSSPTSEAAQRFKYTLQYRIFSSLQGPASGLLDPMAALNGAQPTGYDLSIGEAFIAPQSLIESKCIVQLANLPDLYRVFERC
ncbi:DNA mismatch repair protein MutL [Ramicandelaber brevisporus]|nr:DNA mismatch repair protein MutL [Ramicandelaber brevisporus]